MDICLFSSVGSKTQNSLGHFWSSVKDVLLNLNFYKSCFPFKWKWGTEIVTTLFVLNTWIPTEFQPKEPSTCPWDSKVVWPVPGIQMVAWETKNIENRENEKRQGREAIERSFASLPSLLVFFLHSQYLSLAQHHLNTWNRLKVVWVRIFLKSPNT